MISHRLIRRLITGIVLAIATATLYLIHPIAMTLVLIYALGHILLIEWPSMIAPWQRSKYLVTLFYPTMPLLMMIQFNQSPDYRGYLFAIIALVALFDTASFAVGTLLGRHQIAPAISPGKTWEGALGGCIITTVTLVYVASSICHWHWLRSMMSGILLSITALGGDLFESWFKRVADQKDSGSLLPGHGGILDRIDGILAVVTLVYFVRLLLV